MFLSSVAGNLLIAWPGIGAVSLAIVVGACPAVYGIVVLASAATSPSGERVSDPRVNP
jgi:uncharacterized membrane protein HdeD (DUF308 family)